MSAAGSVSNQPHSVFQAKWPDALIVKSDTVDKSDGTARVIISDFGVHSSLSKKITDTIITPVRVSPEAPMTRLNLLGRSPVSEEFFVTTPDNQSLHTILVPGWHSPHKAIIFCNPNETPMETMGPVFLRMAYEAGCTGVIFNPRGVDRSSGSISAEGLGLDAYTVFEYLVHEKGMDPSDIIIYGRSMGGGWGAEAASMAQKQYPEHKINFISERSFRSLTSVVTSFVANDIPGLTSVVHGVVYCLLRPSRVVFKAQESVESLKGRVTIIFHKDDGIIKYRGSSLSFSLKDKDCQSSGITRIELKDEPSAEHDGVHYHLRDFTNEEYAAIKVAIKDMLGITFDFEQVALKKEKT